MVKLVVLWLLIMRQESVTMTDQSNKVNWLKFDVSKKKKEMKNKEKC